MMAAWDTGSLINHRPLEGPEKAKQISVLKIVRFPFRLRERGLVNQTG